MTINYKNELITNDKQQNLLGNQKRNTHGHNLKIKIQIDICYSHNFLENLESILKQMSAIDVQYKLLLSINFSDSRYYQKIKIENPQYFSNDFWITFDRLLNLTEIDPDLDEDEEDEILNPSNYAVSKSVETLIELYKILNECFPRGFSSLESRGGVNLIWSNQDLDKEVWVKIPFNSKLKKSVYYRKENDSNLIKNPGLNKNSELLLWLSTEQSII